MITDGSRESLDRRLKILSILSIDGRRNFIDIARELGISHVAVSKHVNKLVESGLLRIKGCLNPELLGFRLVLVFMEIVNEEYMEKIVSKLRNCPRIVFLAKMISGYNLVALFYVENNYVLECMSSICTIRTLEGIRRTEIYLLSEIIKPKHLPITIGEKNLDKTPCGRLCSECIGYKNGKCIGCPATIYYKLSI